MIFKAAKLNSSFGRLLSLSAHNLVDLIELTTKIDGLYTILGVDRENVCKHRCPIFGMSVNRKIILRLENVRGEMKSEICSLYLPLINFRTNMAISCA